MKPSEIRAMNDGDLSEELVKLRRAQFNLRMQSATGQAARPDQYGKIRKDIARIKTVMRERLAAGNEASSQ